MSKKFIFNKHKKNVIREFWTGREEIQYKLRSIVAMVGVWHVIIAVEVFLECDRCTVIKFIAIRTQKKELMN